MSKSKGKSGSDSKFFSNNNRKGENHELREELRSPQRDRKRDAVKKVIANMTVGKDVSSLFTDVVNCIQTDNLELKKLVYLYLINYAKTQPDLALLAVNTFVKDANDPNPLIRALAIRTMGCIRVEKITEYLCEPLNRCLRDEDPYVRKTAAVCVAKLYDISPELVEDRGFLDILRELISDANPSVVSNAVAALNEISDTSGKDVMQVSATVLQKLLAALNECTEWGQVFILDSLSKYVSADSKESEGIIERVSPRLQHANSAVVMSAIKTILHFIEDVTQADTLRLIYKKLAPPLITLLNSDPEIQYIALRNINLIVLKHPKILENEIKVFFCKYNDPIYVKMEKLEIIIRLANDRNIEQVLLEFKEYATEVDVEFVRKSVRAIGRCAIKLNQATEKCINVLLDLIQTKVNYVVQEAIIVIKDIFRKYPNKYEGIIATLCENLENLDEPEAKASMIWIIGEYAERIDNADELLDSFLESFADETSQVQLQLLTAIVKLFLKSSATTQDMVQKVLNLSTEESDNPDLRDRGYIYWRLLSTDPEAARAVVLAHRPEIGDDTITIEPNLLDELISQIGTLSSIYHKPPEAFVMKNLAIPTSTEEEEEGDGEDNGEANEDGASTASYSTNTTTNYPPNILTANTGSTNSNTTKPVTQNSNNLIDLLDDTPSVSAPPVKPAVQSSNLLDDFLPVSQSAAPTRVTKPSIVTAEVGQGVFINGSITKINGKLVLDIDVGNNTSTPIQALAIQFNKNAFGIAPLQPGINLPAPVSNGSVVSTVIPLNVSPNQVNPQDVSTNLQTAIKNLTTNSVFYFVIPYTVDALFTAVPTIDVQAFVQAWKTIDDSSEVSALVNDLPTTDIESIKSKLANKDVSFTAKRDIPEGQQIVTYFTAKTITNVTFLIELKFKIGMNISKVTIKSNNKAYSELCKIAISKIISSN
eukprot:gene18467-24177_t